MAGCMCAGGVCACLIVAGTGVQVEGVGSDNRPYVIASAPDSYEVLLSSTSPTLVVNSPGVSEVGSRAVFEVEIAPGVSATIRMPDGSISAAFPAPGSGIEFFVSGTAGTSEVTWSGGPISWFGGAPSATDLGWFRFVFVGNGFTGEYLGTVRA